MSWNWSTAKVVQPYEAPDLKAKQKWYQERYGDNLTCAIKVARKNLRREAYLCCIGEKQADQ